MKSETLLHTMISQGGIQDLETKAQTDSEVLDDLKTHLKLSL